MNFFGKCVIAEVTISSFNLSFFSFLFFFISMHWSFAQEQLFASDVLSIADSPENGCLIGDLECL